MLDEMIISATTADLDQLQEFEKQCFKHDADRFSKRNLKHLIISDTCKTMLIKNADNVIVAEVIGLLRNFKIPSGRIYKIAVHPQMRKKGTGSRLIRAIEQWFVANGMKKACAEVRESNNASRTMFEKNGYIKNRICQNYYVGGENAVKYWKTLLTEQEKIL